MSTSPWDALERAIALAIKSHEGQRDKEGRPYILHLLRVMQNVDDPIAKQAAVLHDYIEDVGGTREELARHAVSEPAIEAILLLTRHEQSTYCKYVIGLSSNPIARKVKLADLEDNYRIGRVAYRSGHEAEDSARILKYALTYQFLSQIIDEGEYRTRMIPLDEQVPSTLVDRCGTP